MAEVRTIFTHDIRTSLDWLRCVGTNRRIEVSWINDRIA